MARASGVYVAAIVSAFVCGSLACQGPILETPPPASEGPQSQGDGGFRPDPFWPQELPAGWLLGNVVGVAVDSRDNVWIIHRPNSQAGAGETPPVMAARAD